MRLLFLLLLLPALLFTVPSAALADCTGFINAPAPPPDPVVRSSPLPLSCEALREAGEALCASDLLDITDGQIDDRREQACLLEQDAKRWEAWPHPLTLVIYFHGGLVDRDQALESALHLDPVIRQADGTPFYVVYNVGSIESASKGDRERGLFNLPDNRSTGLISRFLKANALSKRRYDTGRAHDDVTRLEDRMREGFAPFPTFDVGRWGMLAWAYMKQSILDGLDMTEASPAPSGAWAHLLGNAYDPEKAGAKLLLDTLAQVIEQRTLATRIVLVGHSTGSIYIAQMIRKAQYLWTTPRTKNQTFDVILLAPAVSYATFGTMLDEAGDRIRNLRVYTMDDRHERKDHALAPVLGLALQPLQKHYTHSLLYTVSGVFEPQYDQALIGLDRFRSPELLSTLELCKSDRDVYASIVKVHAFLKHRFGSLANVFVLSPSPSGARAPYTTRALHHGDFPGDLTTLQSVAALIHATAESEAWPLPQPGDLRSSLPAYAQLTPSYPPSRPCRS